MDNIAPDDAARLIAQQILKGEIPAYDGAMRIWKEVLDRLESRIPDELWPFKSNASAIEDCLWDMQDSGADHSALIATCQEEIMAAARRLCRSG